MRIIAGTKRGTKLLPPKGDTTRPILDRVKESLFSVLYKYDVIKDGFIADLFCGTGSLGLEAASRGAERVVFIEQNKNVVAILKQNIEKAALLDSTEVIRANAFKTVAPAGLGGRKYDLVFVDPPYVMTRDVDNDSQLGGLLVLLGERLADNGIVAVRTEKYVHLLEHYGKLEVTDRRRWGTMAVTLLRLIGESEQ